MTKQFHELFEQFNITNGFMYQMKDEKFKNSIMKNDVKNINTFYGLRWFFCEVLNLNNNVILLLDSNEIFIYELQNWLCTIFNHNNHFIHVIVYNRILKHKS